MRRAVLHLVLGVIALDAAAMALYYLGGISHRGQQTHTIFTVAWALVTALVVAVLLRRVRRARS